MYRNKKDVDKHVENLLSKLSVKEFKTRAYSVARLYFDVGDFANCQKHVEQYITQKDNNAAAYKLLGQALQKLGQKDKALEQYKTSLDIDPTQTSVVLDICELLADEDVTVEPGQAKYWCEKVEATFPRHPVTFRLRERLVTMSNPDPVALVNLLKAELAIRPKDVLLHIRLLKHYMHINQFRDAFEHTCNIEFTNNNPFVNNYAWYENLLELLKINSHNANDWLYQLLLLTVRERICMLTLTETTGSLSKSLIECNELLHDYDQAIEVVAKAGPGHGFAEFHAILIQHHQGQFAFHAATLLLKRAKKCQLNWKDAIKFAAPLMLLAWHTTPLDPKAHWLRHAPDKQMNAIFRWLSEGSYRCSQSGHYLLTNVKDKSQSVLDQISQCCSGMHWRDKLYEKIFPSRAHLTKIKTSHFVSHANTVPVLRLPRKTEIETYDCEAQKEFGSSLHHFAWTLLNYKNMAHFKCTLFEMLTPTITACGPETLNKLDIQAFLYCATLTCKQQKAKESSLIDSDKPIILPANITDILCPLPQLKWWDCAYKFTQNGLGTELTDIRATLTRGIEVVRCIDNHGLDAELLCILGRIFNERSKEIYNIEEKNHMEMRAALYYSSAIPILEKLKCKMVVKIPDKRLFDYTHKDLTSKDINLLIEESKLYVASRYYNDCEYDKVLEILTNLKSPQAFFYLSQTYEKLAQEESNVSQDITPQKMSKYATLLSKAKSYAYKALDRLKEIEASKSHPLYTEIHELIENIETHINKLDPDLSTSAFNYGDCKYSSDDNVSNDQFNIKTNRRIFRNVSSTPKVSPRANITSYQSAIDIPILESSHVDKQFLEKIENEITTLHRRDAAINEFMDQTKNWFKENQNLGNQIMTIHTDMQNTTDQFKLLKISIDHVKDQINECRNECKDVGEIKKQIVELKKEINKLKKTATESTIDENDLYHIDEEYRTNDTTSTFSAQLPFPPSQVMPPLNQRLIPPFPIPPNPYQLYGPTLHNLYNHFSQFSQATSAPGPPPMFDPTRTQVNYPNMYPTPDQIYLDVAHLVPSNATTASAIPSVPIVPKMPAVPTVSAVPTMPVISIPASVITSRTMMTKNTEVSRSLPINVVITSSDPLPTATITPAPVLSVTIPSKHIKGTPHNYQIPMPTINESKIIAPPVFNFPFTNKTSNTTPSSSSLTRNVSSIQTTFKPPESSTEGSILISDTSLNKTLDNSTSVVDGICIKSSPNTSVNKSRTYSEKSNTSVDNYDPCPDFKPIVPLPAEVIVKTGEEDEVVVFCARAKLFRFVDKQWKERGLGDMKLLKHKITGKVRVLMRREQIHKICANHIISSEMEIKPMLNETKAYFWVAHDFADENMILEKFCIRFKTADIALEFYNTFEKARQEASNSSTDKIILNTDTTKTETSDIRKFESCDKDKTGEVISTPLGKSVIGGFTFSSTPTFKPLPSNNENISKPSEQVFNKSNIFGRLALKATDSSPFSNLFSAPSTETSSSTNTLQTLVSSKLNISDTVEEYEPSVDFKPIIPLPALVDQKTGEEDEVILFEHRAKLLRFISATKEWKERGLGNIKLLVHKDNINKVRLLMRREQIMKICCNHALTKDMIFQKMTNIDKAVTWCAKDYSDGELIAETFCLRFKTVQVCNDFVDAVKSAQSKMKDESKTAKEEQNAAKQNIQTVNVKNTIGWGDIIKPKSGSWECQHCLIRNEPSVHICSACNNPKEAPSVTSMNKTIFDNTSKFSFGIPSQNVNSVEPKKDVGTPNTFTWGDKFKPKEGSWECACCFVRNENNLEICSACSNPKDPIVKKDNNSIFGVTAPTNQFRFGCPPIASNQQKVTETSSTSIFDGTGTHKFNFGIPKRISDNLKSSELLEGQINIDPKSNSENVGPINFSLKNSNDYSKIDVRLKTTLLPTPQTNIDKDNDNVGFVFAPKTSVNDITCDKVSKGSSENSDNNGSENKGDSSISKASVLSKVLDETSRDNETTLYHQTAELFRFVDGEWKKRGVGFVKILKENDTEKVRVFMQNEQTLKACLNHTLAPEITYTPRDDKTWLFAANDFSEGESSLQQFCLTFSNSEMAMQFKNTIDKVRDGKFDSEITCISNTLESDNTTEANEDVIFVRQINATTEEQEKAKELMLPENFFTYKNKEPCLGCRGCDEHNEAIINYPTIPIKLKEETASVTVTRPVTTPDKPSISSIESPASSLYGTPVSYEKNFEKSIFRTYLDSNNTVIKSATPILSKDTNIFTQGNYSTNIENNDINQISGNLGGFNEQTQSEPPSILASGDTKYSATPKTSVLALPKLSTTNTLNLKETVDTKLAPGNHGFGDMNSVFGYTGFGTSTNRSIFDTAATVKSEIQNDKCIFGGDKQNTVNLFSKTTQGRLFGPITTNENDSKLTTGPFVPTSQNSLFGTDKSLFGNALTQDCFKNDETGYINLKSDAKNSFDKAEEKEVKKETLLCFDSNISFADLSTSVDGSTFERKPNFQWEGAGQQLFTEIQRSRKSKNDSEAGDEASGAVHGDEEYDPHYEPVVPLPDKIVVTTGEEDEKKLYGERCKLYRYDDKTREWKERGVGEIKILYHPNRNTYRLLLRREQILKLVLNMMLFNDLEMLPMMKSDRAWTWAGINYAENPSGEQETLAVRFKTTELASRFYEQVVASVRKLQALTAKAIADEKNAADKHFESVAPLRLPKHLEDSARADALIATQTEAVVQSTPSVSDDQATELKTEVGPEDDVNNPIAVDMFKQVQFREPEEEEEQDEDDYEYDQNYYDQNYNEEEEDEDESGAFYACDGEAMITAGETVTNCENARIIILFDQELCSPKILVNDSVTGETLTDMLIYTETEFQMFGDKCMWSGVDYVSKDPVNKTVTVSFYDSDTAMRFYDSCETSKAAAYSSVDPES